MHHAAGLFSAAGSWNYRGPWEEAHPGPAPTTLKAHLPPHVSGRPSVSLKSLYRPMNQQSLHHTRAPVLLIDQTTKENKESTVPFGH